MSTTRLSASRSGRRNDASTTNVAPCSRCAGPKTSPRKLCATIMWSRTVTLNTGSSSRSLGIRPFVGDTMAERGKFTAGQPRHQLGQLVEVALAADEGVEHRIGEQVQGQRQPVGEAAPTA